MAHKLWDNPITRKYKNCWCQPLDDTEMINLSVKFTLSQPVVSFLPPGDPARFLKRLDAVKKYQPIIERERIFLAEEAQMTSSIGSKTEVFI